MTTADPTSPASGSDRRAPPTEQTLRRLFLTLFLRGRSSRGLKRSTAPKSVGRKLAGTLGLYALTGLAALMLLRQPIFALSIYLQAITFAMLGMFVAASAGEILFNKDEADILMHRPVAPRTLLWAKIRVLFEVSLWLAAALNLVGMFAGLGAPDGDWRFPFVHALSTAMEALFCTGSVVLVYQLCLRWFGRQRLEGIMTTAQVILAVGAVLGAQLLPQLVFRVNKIVTFGRTSWWMALFPPAWFAGVDDALAGTMAAGSWLLAAFAVAATGAVSWLAFDKLARDYLSGLQSVTQSITPRRSKRRRPWLDILAAMPPWRWWLRDPVARASFLLVTAYLIRDRDVKLRVYPSIAPVLTVPIIILAQNYNSAVPAGAADFSIAFAGAYLGIIPMLALSVLQYSQQWQASDIFRVAPIPGPGRICHGARQAVLCFLTVPAAAVFGLLLWLAHRTGIELLIMLPGILAVPIFAMLPSLGGQGMPLSLPAEEAKSAGRALSMVGAMIASAVLAGLAMWSWQAGWFVWLIAVESVLVIGIYTLMRRSLTRVGWQAVD